MHLQDIYAFACWDSGSLVMWSWWCCTLWPYGSQIIPVVWKWTPTHIITGWQIQPAWKEHKSSSRIILTKYNSTCWRMLKNVEHWKSQTALLFPSSHHEPRTLPTAGVDAAPFVPPIAALVAAFFAALVAALLPSVPSSVPSRVTGASRFLPVSFLRHRLKSNDATRFRDMVRMEVWGFNGTLVYIHNR